ncbi:MAG: hypothetical protein IPK03_07470 [Bacteroidetes bacterium]|nr:hypothetical protein [Bacteroidota bacterium]
MMIQTTFRFSLFILLSLSISCSKTSSSSSTEGSTLRILTSPTGQYQRITANIDNTGYTNFDPQAILADGGSVLSHYTWSLDLNSNPPAGVTIDKFTGVINRLGNSSTGLKKGLSTFKVIVSDGNSTATETIELYVGSYTPGPKALLQQLDGSFALVNGVANKAYAATLYAAGGEPPYKWDLDETYVGSSDLTAAGLTVDQMYGIVRGTSFNSSAGKIIKFKVKLTDATGDVSYNKTLYSITVE